jgi:gelsolin
LPKASVSLFQVSDSGAFTEVAATNPSRSHLTSGDAFVLDASSDPLSPTVYVWLGKDATPAEGKYALRYAHRFLAQKDGANPAHAVAFVKIKEGNEPDAFRKLLA